MLIGKVNQQIGDLEFRGFLCLWERNSSQSLLPFFRVTFSDGANKLVAHPAWGYDAHHKVCFASNGRVFARHVYAKLEGQEVGVVRCAKVANRLFWMSAP